MHLPYIPDPPSVNTEAEQEIVDRVRARRYPRPLQALDLTLLHSPPVADGWNSFLGAIRTKMSLPDDIREIAICRVAALNGALYEWEHHAPLARKGGVNEEGLKVLQVDNKVWSPEEEKGNSEEGGFGGLTRKQWAVVRYTDAMTRDIKVSEEMFRELQKHFNDKEIVEITATVACYNCVSRFLVALDVGEKNDKVVSH